MTMTALLALASYMDTVQAMREKILTDDETSSQGTGSRGSSSGVATPTHPLTYTKTRSNTRMHTQGMSVATMKDLKQLNNEDQELFDLQVKRERVWGLNQACVNVHATKYIYMCLRVHTYAHLQIKIASYYKMLKKRLIDYVIMVCMCVRVCACTCTWKLTLFVCICM